MGIGDRLREERMRTGLTQTEFAELAGVKKNAQSNYEKGERAPDAEYLIALADAGYDVLYILTGVRQTPPAESLTVRENCMLANYRALPEEDQAAVQRMTHALAKSVKDESA